MYIEYFYKESVQRGKLLNFLPYMYTTCRPTWIFYSDAGRGVVLQAVAIATDCIREAHRLALLLQLLKSDLKEEKNNS